MTSICFAGVTGWTAAPCSPPSTTPWTSTWWQESRGSRPVRARLGPPASTRTARYTAHTFEPFAQPDITRLTELRLSALEDRIGADLSLGEHRGLAGELAQLVREHPLRERLAGQFMVTLCLSGRQADALRTYGRLRETLIEQLGIEPNPTLARLE